MAFNYSPGLHSAGTGHLYFPQPISQLSLGVEWDYSSHKVPAKSGITTYGHSIGGFPVTVVGVFERYNTTILSTEELMFDYFNTMQTALASITRTNLASLIISRGTGNWRRYKDVFPVSFSMDMGDSYRDRFSYTLQLAVEDPTVYTTAP